MIDEKIIDYINVLLIEFHNYKININVSEDNRILNILHNKNIRVITEDSINEGKDPRGNWFNLL